jgi:hypothetical protein
MFNTVMLTWPCEKQAWGHLATDAYVSNYENENDNDFLLPDKAEGLAPLNALFH